MALDVLKSCEKYNVQIIVNPSLYWITKFESGKSYKREMEVFKHKLAKHVTKSNDCEIPNKSLVAVKEDGEFYRGLITDIFNRNTKITYSLLLIDYGKVIEATKDKIYLILNKALKEQKSKAMQLSLHGVQPACLDIDDKNSLNGIFHKRKCNNWCPNAFKFVDTLFRKNPQVFVKVINSKNNCLIGDIYFIQESDEMPVLLKKVLCDEGFAVLCSSTNSTDKENLQYDRNYGIESKIPQNALCKDIEECDTFRHFNGTLSTSLETKVIQSKKSKPDASPNSNVKYSSSWILKKCQVNNLTSPPKTFSEHKTTAEFKPNCNFSKTPEVNLFRVAMKTLEHFERHKKS